MKRELLVLLGIAALILGLTLQAQAFTLTYTGTSTEYVQPTVNGQAVFEREDPAYGAQNLINFTIPSGLTIDNPSGTPPPTNVKAVVDTTPGVSSPFYTKQFVFNASDTPGNITVKDLEFTFHVQNNTPFIWTNYEFLVTSTSPNGSATILEPASNASPFKAEAFNATTLVYYQSVGGNPNQVVDPGDTALFNFKLEIPKLTGDQTVVVNFEQVATVPTGIAAVPIPPTALLLGSGLLRLVGSRRFRKG